jgi:hypothetical protein
MAIWGNLADPRSIPGSSARDDVPDFLIRLIVPRRSVITRNHYLPLVTDMSGIGWKPIAAGSGKSEFRTTVN